MHVRVCACWTMLLTEGVRALYALLSCWLARDRLHALTVPLGEQQQANEKFAEVGNGDPKGHGSLSDFVRVSII
eukprot:SAG11_NODE_1556_length_4688_cov_7.338636_2_plen_74_part_00